MHTQRLVIHYWNDMVLDIRSCRPDELQRLLPLLDEEFIFGKGRTVSLGLRFPALYCHNNLHNIIICTDGSEIVSALAMHFFDWREGDELFRGAMIGAVYTHPGRRKEGWASRLLAEAALRLRVAEVDFGVLWTGQQSFYARLGWIAADCSVLGEIEANGHGKCAPLDSEKLLAGHPNGTRHARFPDGTTSHSTKPASGQVAGYLPIPVSTPQGLQPQTDCLPLVLPQAGEGGKDSLREFHDNELLPESSGGTIRLSAEAACPRLEAIRQRCLNAMTLRGPEHYRRLPLPAERVDILWREEQHGTAYALCGSSGETRFLYELVGDAACFPALWGEACHGRQRVFINDRPDSPSCRWLTVHAGVNWKSKTLAMWLPLSKRVSMSRLGQWYIPYFDRI